MYYHIPRKRCKAKTSVSLSEICVNVYHKVTSWKRYLRNCIYIISPVSEHITFINFTRMTVLPQSFAKEIFLLTRTQNTFNSVKIVKGKNFAENFLSF